MDYILHIDTSASVCSILISADGLVKASRTNNDSRNFSQFINLMIDEVMREAGISFKDLSAVSVCGGPGSYTGLRIGMATAKGICYATGKPLIIPDKLELLAWQVYKENHDYDYIVSVLYAREKEYFLAVYDKDFKTVLHPQHINEEELPASLNLNGKICVTGNTGINTFVPTLVANIVNEENLIHLAWVELDYKKFINKMFADLAYSEPFYLKHVYTHK